MEKEPKGMYQRLLAEAAEERKSGGSIKTGSPVLDDLLEKAPQDMPEYTRDVMSLYSMISPVGPYNWAASAWFDCLKRMYPSEYERLETEALGRGHSLRVGFKHGRRFERAELQPVNKNEYLVFCENLYPEGAAEAEFAMFFHEADVLLHALAHEVECGAMTVEEAWKTWGPYRRRRRIPHLYEIDGRTWFPDMDWIMESGITATDDFKHDAGRVGRRGVNFTSEEGRRDSPMPIGSIFKVGSREALASLREALSGRYRILVRDQREYAELDFGLRDAVELLDREITAGYE